MNLFIFLVEKSWLLSCASRKLTIASEVVVERLNLITHTFSYRCFHLIFNRLWDSSSYILTLYLLFFFKSEPQKKHEDIKPKPEEEEKPSNRPFDIANLTRPDKPDSKRPVVDVDQNWGLSRLTNRFMYRDLGSSFRSTGKCYFCWVFPHISAVCLDWIDVNFSSEWVFWVEGTSWVERPFETLGMRFFSGCF